MPSLLNALSQAGLANESEVSEQQKKEAENLAASNSRFEPKTTADIFAMAKMGFFVRIKWIVNHLDSTPSAIDEAITAVQKNMCGGQAGKDFLEQLKRVKNRDMKLDEIRAQWPKAFDDE